MARIAVADVGRRYLTSQRCGYAKEGIVHDIRELTRELCPMGIQREYTNNIQSGTKIIKKCTCEWCTKIV